MNLSEVKRIMCDIFTDGYMVNNILIKCTSPTKLIVTHDDNHTYFKFDENLPYAQVQKFIKFKVYIEGIVFGKDSGVLKVKNFPDINFLYDNSNKSFGAMPKELCFKNIDEEINTEFKGEAKRKLAKKCLQYAEAWATIASLNGVTFDRCDKYDRFVLRNKCYYFVEDQLKQDKELQYGAFISIFVLSLILPTIIKWAVDRVIRALLT